jgi:hypothetical protein
MELAEKKGKTIHFLGEMKDTVKREIVTISRQTSFMLQIFSEGVRLA